MLNGVAYPNSTTRGGTSNIVLSVTDIAIGAMLSTDRKNVQTPIYYVCRTFTDPETRYSMLEKLVLALVYAARRLRRYFQGHPINVLTGYKLKNVLSKLELSGRLEKWAIELGEHAIEYKPRPAIKGQVLADFVTEVPQHKEKGCLVEQQPQEKDLILQFSSFKIVHIKRSENKSADALSKFASTNFEHFAKDIRIEVLNRPSIPQNQVLLIQTGVESWMTPIMAYLSSGIFPEDQSVARKIKHKALNYQMNDDVLYRRSFLGPLL
ncbi:uncharacterized protein LOC143563906 [Bidens hawaiensis]|uniref:uncharacterized protein LOC143563906 n=1 Tax=Bidens hawaiensis TaxID=980011 RepID=UPI00404A1208